MKTIEEAAFTLLFWTLPEFPRARVAPLDPWADNAPDGVWRLYATNGYVCGRVEIPKQRQRKPPKWAPDMGPIFPLFQRTAVPEHTADWNRCVAELDGWVPEPEMADAPPNGMILLPGSPAFTKLVDRRFVKWIGPALAVFADPGPSGSVWVRTKEAEYVVMPMKPGVLQP